MLQEAKSKNTQELTLTATTVGFLQQARRTAGAHSYEYVNAYTH